MQKFETNKTYTTRSVCNHECVFTFHVVKRTAKTVTLSNDSRTDMDAKGKTFRVKPTYDNVSEMFKPFGSYSMAPIIRAA
jgi:hypothetical protein